VARLALMAGLNRGEVESLLARRAQRRQLRARGSQKIQQLSVLLAAWHDDSRFNTPYGLPLDLSLRPERSFRTFGELVEATCPGGDSSLILDELLAAGCIELHEDKFVRCISRVFIPTGVDVSRIVRMGEYVGAFNATMAHNLLRKSDEPSYYERVMVTGAPVRREFREAALHYLNTTFQPFLEQMDRWWESTGHEFANPEGARYGLCAFFYEEQRSQNEIEPAKVANSRPN